MKHGNVSVSLAANQIFDLKRSDKFADFSVYFCTLLACLVPRYLSNFKLHVGLNISFYTVSVFIFCSVFFLLRFKNVIIKWNYNCLFLGIWLLFIVGSVWRIKMVGVWAYYLIWISTSILFQQLLLHFNRQKMFDIIINAMVDGLFLHLLMGFYEITTHTYLFETGNVNYLLRGHVAIGMFYNLNDYATFVTTIFPLAIYKLFTSERVLLKIYYCAIASGSVYMIINSESRGALLALLSIFALSVFLYWKKSKRSKILILSLIAVALACVVSSPAYSLLKNEITTSLTDPTGRSDFARLNLIKNGLFFLKETSGLGVGAGNVFWWLENRAIYPIGQLLFLHNWYLEVMVTFGVVFFCFYLAFHLGILMKLFINITQKSVWTINNVLLLSFTGFSIVSISSSSNIYSEWVWMYFTVMGTYCALNCRDKRMVRILPRNT